MVDGCRRRIEGGNKKGERESERVKSSGRRGREQCTQHRS
jgi:hypothetical protein